MAKGPVHLNQPDGAATPLPRRSRSALAGKLRDQFKRKGVLRPEANIGGDYGTKPKPEAQKVPQVLPRDAEGNIITSRYPWQSDPSYGRQRGKFTEDQHRAFFRLMREMRVRLILTGDVISD